MPLRCVVSRPSTPERAPRGNLRVAGFWLRERKSHRPEGLFKDEESDVEVEGEFVPPGSACPRLMASMRRARI
jgi:hypothetical protein